MAQKIPFNVIKSLPKAELHCHLDGSISAKTIIELAKEHPTFDEAELKKLISVDETCESLIEYLRGFDITGSVLQKPFAITRAVYEVCKDACADGIRYIEIRFSPVLHLKSGLSMGGVMEAAVEGLVMSELRLPIIAKLIVCGLRSLDPKVTESIAEIAWRYKDRGVVGFDLAGGPEQISSKHHREAFSIVHNKLINCTLHSGEASGWQSVQDALQYCGAHRIGHGCHLIQNDDLRKYVVDRGVTIESCVTSNIHTKAVSNFDDHPIRQFFDEGIVIVPCTDNRTVSDCTLSGEYDLIQEKYKFSVENMVRMIDYGWKSTFLGVKKKRRLRAEMLKEIVTKLNKANIDVSSIINHPYYDDVGLDFKQIISGESIPYWRLNHTNPPITKELIKRLPKADLNVRLGSGYNIEQLWKYYSSLPKDDRVYPLKSVEELKIASYDVARDIMERVLQTKEQIEDAVDSVFSQAVSDGVTYVEIVLRPKAHTLRDLKEKDVLDIVESRVSKNNGSNKNCKAALVLYANPRLDDPTQFKDLSEVVVGCIQSGKSNIVGFGVYGEEELDASNYKYFLSTFEYLKKHRVNVSIASGSHSSESIISAVHMGGGRRLSGAFKMHENPTLMNYLANHRIPVEIGPTAKYDKSTSKVQKHFSPIRLFIDNGVPIVICSFKSVLDDRSRVDVLQEVVDTCALSIRELYELLGEGFKSNFQSHSERQVLHQKYLDSASNLLEKEGFQFYRKNTFFS
eukprot:CAMPEP_0168539588 /NCGR_PEP_ID=MMETSP0405-20121227/21924_1 /TAXON_ID=498012 /ORGANISM="Trichosphaerium sp, Strain Am-I-7 wt" /LENGTH=739 /DNA_ID=CAMNT_0008569193 /DNA_START=17 /DNA_END=2236 /DNA_ORIENTATION=-